MTQEEILIEKAKKGELSEDEITELDKTLSDDQRREITAAASAEMKTTLTSLSAIRQEKNRIQKLVDDGKNQLGGDDTPPADPPPADPPPADPPSPPAAEPPADPEPPSEMQQFREEQKEKAVGMFKERFPKVTDEDMTKVMEHYATLGSPKIDAELILKDIIGSYAFVNSEALIAAQQEGENLEAGAAAANADEAGAPSSAPAGGEEPKKYPEHVKDLAKRANISEEAAAKVADEGLERTYR